MVALWGSSVGCPAACSYILQASVRPPGGNWGTPVTVKVTDSAGDQATEPGSITISP